MEDRRNSFNLESLTKHSIVSSISSKKGKLRDGPHCNLIADVGIDHYKWKKKDQVGYEWLESNSQLLYHTILLLKNKKNGIVICVSSKDPFVTICAFAN